MQDSELCDTAVIRCGGQLKIQREGNAEQLSKYDLVIEAHLTQTCITGKVEQNFFTVYPYLTCTWQLLSCYYQDKTVTASSPMLCDCIWTWRYREMRRRPFKPLQSSYMKNSVCIDALCIFLKSFKTLIAWVGSQHELVIRRSS